MKHIIVNFLLLVGCVSASLSQSFTVSGYIRDAATGDALLFANCYDSLSNIGASTNSYGFFTIALTAGRVKIIASYIGYQHNAFCFTLKKDTSIIIELAPISKELQEVVVSARIPLHQQVIMGKTTITPQTIESIPSFVGEKDVMKAISFIPGISTGKEGYSNIYVRGGDRGQNLILLDGARLYNTNHVGGFVSLFNPNIIKFVDVYKGGFPARYGGRVSSVIDVYTKDGNAHSYSGKYCIGILSSSILYEGPIRKDLSFILSLRSSYYDLFTIPARRDLKQTGTGSYWGYTFFDVNAKLNWQQSKRNRLFLSIFSGHDIQKAEDVLKASFQESTSIQKLNINNTSISVSHIHILTPRVFVKNSIAFSNYQNNLCQYDKDINQGIQFIDEINTNSRINDLTFQNRFEIAPNNSHSVKTGIEYSIYSYIPSLQMARIQKGIFGVVIDTTLGVTSSLAAYESNVYLEDEISIVENIKFNAGIRCSRYGFKDTVYYRTEPRLSLRWLITKTISFKANYSVMNQFNHVLVNNIRGFEKEVWLAASKKLPPQKAQQVSAGIFISNERFGFELSLESYYKKMSDLIEYNNPTSDRDIVGNVEDLVENNGKGEAYGVEVNISKSHQRFDLGLNYTLSWNNRKFENINNGKWYPFIYDRRHNVSFLALVKLSNKYSFSSNFTLASGTPFTMPEGYVKEDAFTYGYFVYNGINNYRLPLYHRLDISIARKGKTRKGNNKQLEINIYNVYARQNPIFIHYDVNTGKVYQKSLFTIIPTISYSVEF